MGNGHGGCAAGARRTDVVTSWRVLVPLAAMKIALLSTGKVLGILDVPTRK